MSDPSSDFSHLMRLAAEGDQDACAWIFHTYNNVLRRHINIRLGKIRHLRSRLDAEDIAQIVWIAFFTSVTQRQQFTTSGQLVRFLARLTRNQLLKAARDHLDAQKRSLRRHQYLSEANAAIAVADSSPTPAQAAEVRDEWERWLRSLTGDERQVVLMLRDGFHYSEIAAEFGSSVRTIERIVCAIRRPSRSLTWETISLLQ